MMQYAPFGMVLRRDGVPAGFLLQVGEGELGAGEGQLRLGQALLGPALLLAQAEDLEKQANDAAPSIQKAYAEARSARATEPCER